MVAHTRKCLHSTCNSTCMCINLGITSSHRKHWPRTCCPLGSETVRGVLRYVCGKSPRPVTIHSIGETIARAWWPPVILQRIFPQQYFLSRGTLSDAESWAGGDGSAHGISRSQKKTNHFYDDTLVGDISESLFQISRAFDSNIPRGINLSLSVFAMTHTYHALCVLMSQLYRRLCRRTKLNQLDIGLMIVYY